MAMASAISRPELIDRLDYFTELGVTGLWLLPFYPSPLKDDGYDIADYFAVNPSYGTVEDFRTFLDLAHEKGLRVITELVLNHTSDQKHALVQCALGAPRRARPERDFLCVERRPAEAMPATTRIIFKDFETSELDVGIPWPKPISDAPLSPTSPT